MGWQVNDGPENPPAKPDLEPCKPQLNDEEIEALERIADAIEAGRALMGDGDPGSLS